MLQESDQHTACTKIVEKFDALGDGGRGVAYNEDSDLHREGKSGVMRFVKKKVYFKTQIIPVCT